MRDISVFFLKFNKIQLTKYNHRHRRLAPCIIIITFSMYLTSRTSINSYKYSSSNSLSRITCITIPIPAWRMHWCIGDWCIGALMHRWIDAVGVGWWRTGWGGESSFIWVADLVLNSEGVTWIVAMLSIPGWVFSSWSSCNLPSARVHALFAALFGCMSLFACV